MRIFVYGKNTSKAGQRVPQSIVRRVKLQTGLIPESWRQESVSDDNLELHEELGGPYHRRVAESIKDVMK